MSTKYPRDSGSMLRLPSKGIEKVKRDDCLDCNARLKGGKCFGLINYHYSYWVYRACISYALLYKSKQCRAKPYLTVVMKNK